MTDPAISTMATNLEAKTGRSLTEWVALVQATGLDKHGQIMKLLKSDYGLTHGYANLIAMTALNPPSSDEDLVKAQYAGGKAALLPVYEAVVAMASRLGGDVEVAPRKTYVSLRRSKQFGLVKPASRARLEIGLNLPDKPGTDRLKPTQGMCTHIVNVSSVEDIDEELRGWLAAAYQRA
jgi:predicted transport protein